VRHRAPVVPVQTHLRLGATQPANGTTPSVYHRAGSNIRRIAVVRESEDGRECCDCVGVIISDRHVLTAAHCASRIWPTSVIVGEHRLDGRDAFEREVPAEVVCIAEEYNISKSFDWALITLKEPVEFNNHVRPACLPFKPINRTETGLCHVVGAGRSDFHGNRPEVVQKLRVKRVHCPHHVSDLGKFQECYTTAGSDPREQVFYGDSGSPVLCLDENNRWTVTGLVKGACDIHPHRPSIGVYTKLRTQLQKIKTQCNF
jgi:hypothetical protein